MKDKLGIGFAGAHRTGKTTLAKAFAEKYEIPFVQTSISMTFRDLGYDPAKDYDLPTRLKIQNVVLDNEITKWSSYADTFVSDRTPIDMIAYTLASAHQEEITTDLDIQLQNYINRCIDVNNTYFGYVFEVLPAIQVIHEEGKANIVKSHIDHISLIISGICNKDDIRSTIITIPKKKTDLSDRIEFCSGILNTFEL